MDKKQKRSEYNKKQYREKVINDPEFLRKNCERVKNVYKNNELVKEQTKKRVKEYAEQHPEKVKQWREATKERNKNDPTFKEKESQKRKKYYNENQDKIKQKRENNKEYTKNYNKEYNQLAKTDINKRFIKLRTTCRTADIRDNRSVENLITVDEIKELYDKQNGKCVYTGVKLEPSGLYKVSVDRIDSSIGHIKDNCQLVITPINYMKSDMTHDDFTQMLENIRNNCGVDYTAPIHSMLSSKAKNKIRYLLADIKRRAVAIGKDCKVDSKTFKELRLKQNDICQLTGVPVTWEPKKWNTGSIDRIDSSRGYTLDNIQIVLWPINMMKNDLTNDEALDIINLIL